VYRVYGGTNSKNRPPYFDKATCLASFLRAAEAADREVIVLANGPIPDELISMVAGRGRLIYLEGGPVKMQKSWLTGLRLPGKQGWPDEDLVYFCEDDYLHVPEALVELEAAAEQIPAAHYFALYGSTPRNPTHGPGVPFQEPASWVAAPEVEVNGRQWVNIPSTASTFGARVGSLKADFGIWWQGTIPYPTRYLDHESNMVLQGRFPYRWTELFAGPPETRYRTGVAELAANIVQTPFRTAYQLRALTRRRTPHLFYAADPNLACHLDLPLISPGTDWAEQARQAQAWAGLPESDVHDLDVPHHLAP
jgi:hypothetical protein